MGLADVLKNAAQTIVKATGNIAFALTYTQSSPVYSPVTGLTTDAGISYATTAIRDEFEEATFNGTESDTTPKRGDFNLLIATNDLAVTPTGVGFFTIDGIQHSIINIKTDPANALWTIHVRVRK